MSVGTAVWRRMAPSDLPGLIRIGDEVTPRPTRGRQRVHRANATFPEGCLVLVRRDETYGYAISHPIRKGRPPALDILLGELPAEADEYYIHDVAVMLTMRKQGYAAKVIKQVLDVAKRYEATSLISVYGTTAFCERFGFEPQMPQAEMTEKLRRYGKDAVYMSRKNKR